MAEPNRYEQNYARLERILGQPLTDLEFDKIYRLQAAGFMDFIVEGYVPCQFFFAAYPDATVKQVWRALDWENKTRDFQRTLARPTPSRMRDESSAQRAA